MHILLSLVTFLAGAHDAKTVRYGVQADLVTYPQKTPQEALNSVLKAAEAQRFDYLAAQLADPAFIDERVQRLYGGRFAEQVDDTRNSLNAAALALLQRFVKEGMWQVEKDTATATLKNVTTRIVAFRLIDGRWYMEHRSK